uniref:Uncharacterized protein n=1 Tax=Oryza brachyantha TaxID=4533 RepID=J3M778_ORYBR
MELIYKPCGEKELSKSGSHLIFKHFSISSANFSAQLADMEYVSSDFAAREAILTNILHSEEYRSDNFILGSSCILYLQCMRAQNANKFKLLAAAFDTRLQWLANGSWGS